MKNLLKKLLSVLLCICMFIPFSAAVFAEETESCQQYDGAVGLLNVSVGKNNVLSGNCENFVVRLKKALAKFANFLSNLLINEVFGRIIRRILPDSPAVLKYEDFNLDEYGNFYPGMEKFVDKPADDAVWSLGYAYASILPADLGEKEYVKGAYQPNIFGNAMYEDEDGCKEDLRARVIVMNDGSGRGNVVFISLDAIGLFNNDVRLIRAALKDFAQANNIVSINVSCTHIHAGIDSQGAWNDPVRTFFRNVSGKEVKTGVDRTFLQAVIDGSKKAVIDAYADLKPGKLYYSSINIGQYLYDRTPPYSLDPNLYKLEFIPFDTAAVPTIIATFGCHPESSGGDYKRTDENGNTVYDKKFSADFIWYMEKIMNSAGSNFIYIQGNVGTVTSERLLTGDFLGGNAHYSAVRYGYELGYITLTLSNSYEERVKINEALGDRLGVKEHAGEEGYTVWYEGLATSPAEEVKPFLNSANKQFIIEIENNVISVVGKGSIADALFLRDKWGNYYTVSEVGYIEIGDSLKAYLSPGETFSELRYGGSDLDGFPLKSISEQLGEDVIILDLMNDAAGYVANDANFVLTGVQYDEIKDKFKDDSWCIISYGKHTGSTLLRRLYELVDSVK